MCAQIERNLWSLFAEMDADGNGHIDVDELRRCFSPLHSDPVTRLSLEMQVTEKMPPIGRIMEIRRSCSCFLFFTSVVQCLQNLRWFHC